MKYINTDKLISEIERRMNECVGKFGVIHKLPEYRCLKNIRSYITSLQQEQPSLPSNLDEAANRQAALEQPYKWEEEQDGSFGVTPLFVMSNIRSAFKACAEWMAGQGATMEITDDTEWADLDSFVHKNVTGGSIIQIRKK